MTRLMIICQPGKTYHYNPLRRHFPVDITVEVVPADPGIVGALQMLKSRHCRLRMPTNLISKITKYRPDICLTDYPNYPSWYAKAYSWLRMENVPLIVWLVGDFWKEVPAHCGTLGFPGRLASPFVLSSWTTGLAIADHIVPVCRWLEKTVRQRFPRKSTSVLHRGIDPEPWLEPQKSLYAFKHPAIGILQTNNILPKVKGLLWFSNVVRQMEDVQFYIAGDGQYTPLVEKAYAGLRNAHLIGRVQYPEGVKKFYLSTDIYVLASGLDCCPNTLLEASMCGKPAVASRVGGTPELIKEGVTGWSLPNEREDEWISLIRSLIDEPVMAEEMGENARRFVMKEFGWNTQAAKLSSIVRGLLKRG